MAHTIIKFPNGHEDGEQDKNNPDINGWHLHADYADGEFTLCGLAEPEYEFIEKHVQRNGITCPNCLQLLKFCKSIKL